MTPEQRAAVDEWYRAKEEAEKAKKIVEREVELRRALGAVLFGISLKEGVNRIPIRNGWNLKYTHKVKRNIDSAVLSTLTKPLAAAGVSVDEVTRIKIELDTTAYRHLTEEQRAILDQAITSTYSTPTIEIRCEPKEKKDA